MRRNGLRGATAIEAILVAAAFILLGVMGVLVFQRMGASAAEGIRTNAIVTADRGGFDVTIEVLNGRVDASTIDLRFGRSGEPLNSANRAYCVNNGTLYPGQSTTCRFTAQLTPGQTYVYVIYVQDPQSGKAVQVAKGSVTVGVS